MPWNQPFRNSRMNMMAMEEVAHGTRPIRNMIPADRARPSGRNRRGLERSEMLPIRNLARP